MPSIGPLELVIVLVIALIVFGPKRLPELGRSLGRGLHGFREAVGGEEKKAEPAAETASNQLSLEAAEPSSNAQPVKVKADPVL